MGLFSGFFGGSEEENKEEKPKISWIALDAISQLDEIKEKSKGVTQVIFKHSTTCGISKMALKMFTSAYGVEEGKIELNFLDLLQHRNVSNEVAIKFGVTHQSPQLLVIKNGVVVHHDSHGAIADIDLEKYI